MSRDVSNRAIFILSLLGFGVSVYLTLAHMGLAYIPCGREKPCEVVSHDPFARGLGIPALQAIPTAVFGAVTYVILTVLSLFRATGPSPQKERAAMGIQWVLCIAGVATSGYLTYREAFVIHAWCWLCVTSAVIITILFSITTYERVPAK
jgi:uncharacterized membrane protein